MNMRQEAKENLEIRVLRTGKGYRVDVHKIGADETRTETRSSDYAPAIKAARYIAAQLRSTENFGFVRLMIEELF